MFWVYKPKIRNVLSEDQIVKKSLYFLLLLVPFSHLFIYQLNKLDIKDTQKCLVLFKSNNFLGLIIYLNLLAGKII